MRYLSVCSGIEAASVAWHPLGWEPVGFSEIEPFPCAVLAHRFPNVKNYGDMTKYKEWNIEPGTVELLVGGTPCQAFSVAGLRRGLDDPRGNLMLTFGAIANHLRPTWIVWENVPGVLSSDGGRDFGTFLGMLGELGYGFAYRVLDAQYFGVAQRRRRVFLVGYLGDWRPAAAVLFESESLCGYSAPSREAGKGITGTISARTSGGGGLGTDFCNHEAPIIAFDSKRNGASAENLSPTLRSMNHDGSHANAGGQIGVMTASSVRRLTPRECERLQGFPDDWTLIPWRGARADDCPDGPRYKAIGNSMAVPVMRWIGKRIRGLTTAST